MANLWYVSSIVVDLRFRFDVGTLKLFSLAATSLGLLEVDGEESASD